MGNQKKKRAKLTLTKELLSYRVTYAIEYALQKLRKEER